MIIDSRKIKSADRLSEQSDVFEYGYKKDTKYMQKNCKKREKKAEIM